MQIFLAAAIFIPNSLSLDIIYKFSFVNICYIIIFEPNKKLNKYDKNTYKRRRKH